MDSRELLSVGDVAKRSGYAASALRFYEAEGLIPATRTSGGRRQFERNVLRRLAFIRAASNIGLTLDEVREELDRLPEGRVPNRADWQRITRHWRGRLDDQIAALERLRDGLDSCIGCGCLSLQRCQMTNPGDWMAATDDAPGAANLPALLRRPHQFRERSAALVGDGLGSGRGGLGVEVAAAPLDRPHLGVELVDQRLSGGDVQAGDVLVADVVEVLDDRRAGCCRGRRPARCRRRRGRARSRPPSRAAAAR